MKMTTKSEAKSKKLTELKPGMIIENILEGTVFILLRKVADTNYGSFELWDNIENGVFYQGGAFNPGACKLFEDEVVLTND